MGVASEPGNHFDDVLLENVVFNHIKNELDIFSVSGTGEVWVDVRGPFLIDVDKHPCYELSSLKVVLLRACVCVWACVCLVRGSKHKANWVGWNLAR